VDSRSEMVVLACKMELVTPKDIWVYNKKKNSCRFLNGQRWNENATKFILIEKILRLTPLY